MYKVTVEDNSFNIDSENGSFSIDNKAFNADILEFESGKFHIIHDNKSISAELISFNTDDKTFEIKVNGIFLLRQKVVGPHI